MNNRMGDLRNKEVINMTNGTRIGFISDIEVDIETAKLKAIVVYGKAKGFGFLGREEDIVIPWEKIELFGDDTVLVKYDGEEKIECKKEHSSILDKFCF